MLFIVQDSRTPGPLRAQCMPHAGKPPTSAPGSPSALLSRTPERLAWRPACGQDWGPFSPYSDWPPSPTSDEHPGRTCADVQPGNQWTSSRLPARPPFRRSVCLLLGHRWHLSTCGTGTPTSPSRIQQHSTPVARVYLRRPGPSKFCATPSFIYSLQQRHCFAPSPPSDPIVALPRCRCRPFECEPRKHSAPTRSQDPVWTLGSTRLGAAETSGFTCTPPPPARFLRAFLRPCLPSSLVIVRASAELEWRSLAFRAFLWSLGASPDSHRSLSLHLRTRVEEHGRWSLNPRNPFPEGPRVARELLQDDRGQAIANGWAVEPADVGTVSTRLPCSGVVCTNWLHPD